MHLGADFNILSSPGANLTNRHHKEQKLPPPRPPVSNKQQASAIGKFMMFWLVVIGGVTGVIFFLDPERPQLLSPTDIRQSRIHGDVFDQPPESDKLRVMSYNILAETRRNIIKKNEGHVGPDSAQDRLTKIVDHIAAWDADVIILQEVTRYSFLTLERSMAKLGYTTRDHWNRWAKLTDNQPVGVVFFWHKSRVNRVKDVVVASSWRRSPKGTKLRDLGNHCPSLNHASMKQCAAFVMQFEHVSMKKTFVIASTHLEMEPAWASMKTLQMYSFVYQIENQVNKWLGKDAFPKTPILFAVSANSGMDSGLYRLMVHGKIETSDPEHPQTFLADDEECRQVLSKPLLKGELSIGSSWKSLYGEGKKLAWSTNGRMGPEVALSGLVDWVWQRNFGDVEVVEHFANEKFRKDLNGSLLPDGANPSDHIPLVAELAFQ